MPTHNVYSKGISISLHIEFERFMLALNRAH